MPTVYAPPWEARERTPEPPHFVGRSAEIARVQALLHDAALGAGSAVVLAGERGIGKSRFLRECATISSPATNVLAQCGGVPNSGYDLMAQLAERLLPPGASRASRNGSAVYEALGGACKRKPTAILVDDVHLAGPDESRALASLLALTRRLRLVVIACYLQGGAPASTELQVRRWVDAGAGYDCLDPLDDAATELLLRSMLKSGSRPLGTDELREMLHTAQGNPRIAVELVACALGGMRGEGVIAPTARANAAFVRGVLSKADFDVLSLCSVVGDTFHDAWIVDIAQRPRAAVADALQAASDLGVVAERAGSPGWFAFRHVAVRKALYASVVSLKRRLLHERVAERLSVLGGDTPDAQHSMLVARHWHVLESHENAAEWLIRAADDFTERGQFAPAAESYARAAGHLPHGSERWFAVQQRLRRCYGNLGEWARVIPLVRAMLSTFDARSDPERAASLLWDLFFAYLNELDREAAQAVAADIAALNLPSEPDRSAIATLILAYALCYAGRREEAAGLAGEVDPNGLVTGEGRLRYLITAASNNALHEPLERSLELVDRAAQIASGLGIRGTVHCYTDGVEVALRYGDLQAAQEYVRKAAETAAKSAGAINAVKRGVVKERIRLCLLAGDLPTARDLIFSSLEWRDSTRINESFLAGVGVLVGMRMGDFALVDALFDPALLLASATACDAESCGLLLPGFADVMQARGLTKDLRAVLERCVDERLIDPYTWIQLSVARFGTLECADLAAAQMEHYLRDAIAPTAAAHMALFNATLSRRRGKHITASEFARDAAARYRRLGWSLLEAMALEIAGDRDLACVVYARCGATHDAARLAGGQTRKLKRAPFGARLTVRELEVARLVARQWSDNDIARALEISVRTVHHHVEAAFHKLGVRARWQLGEELLKAMDARR